MPITIINEDLYPLLGTGYRSTEFATVDLSTNHLKQMSIGDPNSLEIYLERCKKDKKAKWLLGGYLEQRSLYQSPLFIGLKNQQRDIHLGIDIWGKAGSPIYAPLDGYIHSYAYNEGSLDYGYTLILSHHYLKQQFYTLYGHLGSSFAETWKSGKRIIAGDHIADFGNKEENGGWLPHLHFQLILDIQNNEGDYPGVCHAESLKYYRVNCPDPEILIKKAP